MNCHLRLEIKSGWTHRTDLDIATLWTDTKKVKEVEVTSIEVRYNLKTNKQEIIYCVDNTGTGYVYNGKVAFTKE